MTPEAQLARLLEDLFRGEELRTFLRHRSATSSMVTELPAGASDAVFAAAVAEALVRRGLATSELFADLVRIRPGRAGDIVACLALLPDAQVPGLPVVLGPAKALTAPRRVLSLAAVALVSAAAGYLVGTRPLPDSGVDQRDACLDAVLRLDTNAHLPGATVASLSAHIQSLRTTCESMPH